MKNPILLILLLAFACERKPETIIPAWTPYDESKEIAANSEHESRRLQYQLIQSRISDRNTVWANVAEQIKYFSEEDYQSLYPLIFAQDIPTIQAHIAEGQLSYEKLTQWYLFRIVKYENNKDTYLNAIININPNAVAEARSRDKNKSKSDHPIYGMPVLLKDNINFEGLPTTAGAHAFLKNNTSDAFIVERIKENGGIILGKTSLSEWANYLCNGCPNGYSAVGGQTLNAYGRKQLDTGGSSSGSGVAMAANYAAAAVGSETSGSILSPSSKSSLVGLKPTIGLLSRGGIVPISSTLDTPGPMTRNVIDNAIMLSAMSGKDAEDQASANIPEGKTYWDEIAGASFEGMRFGVNSRFTEDSLYMLAVGTIVAKGGVAIVFEPSEVEFEGFGTLLDGDMKIDLPKYIQQYGSKELTFKSVQDVLDHNLQDTTNRIPYGQGRLEGVANVDISAEELEEIKSRLNEAGIRFFEKPMLEHGLDAVLSINNYNAGYAAAAKYPCLTLPMGYSEEGEPKGLTFIARPFTEDKLLKMAFAFEQASKARKGPQLFD